MLTDDQIKKISALAAKQAEEKAALGCRQQNEREAMIERHDGEQRALEASMRPAARAGLEDLGSTGLEAGPTSMPARASGG